MAARIEVSRVRKGEFLVTVVEGSTQSKHSVTLKDQDYVRLSGGKIGPEDLIVRAFEFLLKRESKEAILARFDLLEIAHYFPTFEGDMRKTLGTGLG
jgi:hypothetical protein